MAERMCKNCGVKISADLANCPLCGKFVLAENDKVEPTPSSYPIYDYTEINKERALKLIRNIAFIIAAICIFVNLIFWTTPLWVPYVLVSEFALYMMFCHPLRRGGNMLRALPMSGIYAMILLIFIDAYNALTMGLKFGWGFAIAAPCVMSAVVIACAVIAFTKNTFNMSLAKRILYVAIFAIAYFLVKVIAFPSLARWPSLVLVCVSFGFWALLMIIKPKAMAKEMKKDFHI